MTALLISLGLFGCLIALAIMYPSVLLIVSLFCVLVGVLVFCAASLYREWRGL